LTDESLADALRRRILDLPGIEEAAEPEPASPAEEDARVRRILDVLAGAGLLLHVVPASAGGPHETVRCRMVCRAREALAFRSGLADVAFAMQGLGSAAIAFRGAEAQRRAYLPGVARGSLVAAVALTEPEAGSDLDAIATRARRDGDGYVLDGAKSLITNAGIADLYTLFARTSEDPRRGLTCFVVEKDDAGLAVTERLRVLAPHPIGSLELRGCRVPASRRVGEEGDGLGIARQVLDAYRPTVGAAAVGFARRALGEAVAHVKRRRQFGAPLSEQQGIQFMLADSATEIEAAALLVERAAALVDGGEGRGRARRASAMAKYLATETAQRVVDRAVQLHGGRGVIRGGVVERLYREVRALRIYEGASEVQRNIIAREILRGAEGAAR
jgi:acyl-CoA dehydrogenase